MHFMEIYACFKWQEKTHLYTEQLSENNKWGKSWNGMPFMEIYACFKWQEKAHLYTEQILENSSLSLTMAWQRHILRKIDTSTWVQMNNYLLFKFEKENILSGQEWPLIASFGNKIIQLIIKMF